MAMARGQVKLQALLLLLLAALASVAVVQGDGETALEGVVESQYCSFFSNRAPKAQPGLKNCTWFKENSCCMQQEIEATFGRVKPLKGASVDCQRYINYLMCYICAPNQNIFYKRERLTVCESFCDSLYNVCGSAVLKGSVIRDLYPGGREFCLSRRFEVDSTQCFTFDVKLDTSSAYQNYPISVVILLLVSCCTMTLADFPDRLNDKQSTDSSSNNSVSRRRSKAEGNHSFQRRFRRFMTDLSYLTVVLFILSIPKTCGDLTSDEVKKWANKISSEINILAENRLHYKEIQQLYDKAQYATDYINGTAKLFELRDKLEVYFEKKVRLVRSLASEVRHIYDEWYLAKEEKEAERREREERIHKHVHGKVGEDAYGVRDMMFDPQDNVADHSDENVTEIHRTLKDLPLNIYRDADITSHMPRHLMSYKKQFGQFVMMNCSSVKIPDRVNRSLESTVDSVEWTAQLEDAFRKNSQAGAMWQSFGTTSGVYRVFPGHHWHRNFAGFTKDFDPRLRPWYVTATSGPKDVVLVLDGSASMKEKGSLGRMKAISRNVLNSLTTYDKVNVVVSRSSYWESSGRYHVHHPDVLGCRNDTVLPASPAYIQELISAVDAVDVYGGSDHIVAFKIAFNLLKSAEKSNCQRLIVFITDGNRYDNKQRCTPGYNKYNENSQRTFQAGEFCAYDFDNVIHIVEVLQHHVVKRVQMFTFLTDNSGHNHEHLPGKLACGNQGAMAKVVKDENIQDQMMPFYSFIQATSRTDQLVWTSPYMDQGGLGMVTTAALPVYSNVTAKLIGVVAIDTPITFLDKVIRHSRWGDAYAFLIDSRSGGTIVHPAVKMMDKLSGTLALTPITALEMQLGRPILFEKVLHKMMQQKTGDLRITGNAKRIYVVQDAVIWRSTKSSHYFYTGIKNSDYSIAYRLGHSDEAFQYARDPMVSGPISYLHNMFDYSKLGPQFSHVVSGLQITDIHPGYKGVNVTFQRSVVKLSPRTFCHPMEYVNEDKPSMEDIHKYINTFTATYDIRCPSGIYKDDVRSDVKMTAQLETHWKEEWQEQTDLDVVWVYTGTSSGVFRIYPGVELNKEFDPTTRVWYKRSEVNRGQVAVSQPFEDASGLGKVITLGWTIHKVKPLTPPDCTRTLRDYGCPCETHQQCKSEYCYMNSCADDIIQGVAAMDVKFESFRSYLKKAIANMSGDRLCGESYGCGRHKRSLCETRCYLVDNNALLVTSLDFTNRTEEVTTYESSSLASQHGHIFSKLLRQGVFVKHNYTKYQSQCVLSEYVPEIIPIESPWKPSYSINGESSAPGPIPAFQNDFSCIKEVVYYLANNSYSPNGSYIISENLRQDPCAEGTYHFTPLTGTNLFLLVLDNYHDQDYSDNEECQNMNSVLKPGHYPLQYSTCEYGHYILGKNPHRCSHAHQSAVACGYGAATKVSSSPHNVFVTFLFACISFLHSKLCWHILES